MKLLRLALSAFCGLKSYAVTLSLCVFFSFYQGSTIAFSQQPLNISQGLAPDLAQHTNNFSPPMKVLRIGIEGAQPPFNALDRKGGLKGFEPDFALELCRRLQTTCVFERLEWDRLIPALETRKIDGIISSLSISEEMMEKIAFSAPYYRIPSAFMGEKKDLPLNVTPQALQNKNIGTLSKDKFKDYLKDKFPQSHVKVYDTIEEAYLDALNDRIDVFFADRLSLQLFSRTSLGKFCTIIGIDHNDANYFGQGIGVGLRLSDTELKKRIDLAIAHMKQDGTLQRLSKPYFSFSIE